MATEAPTQTSILDFDEALRIVLEQAETIAQARTKAPCETEYLPLAACLNRILAKSIQSDRDQPPFHRSTRDGFAVRSSDSGPLRVLGVIPAGGSWTTPLEPGTTIEIMTGAPVPERADAVVMIEHIIPPDPTEPLTTPLTSQNTTHHHTLTTQNAGAESIQIPTDRLPTPGQNIVPRGSEAHAGDTILPAGTTLHAAEIALAAQVGATHLEVYRKPKVAILATGDELVELDQTPSNQQIRNSNSYGLAALVTAAGADPVRLPIVRDDRAELTSSLHEARCWDLVILTGGVSMGKYDLVEEALANQGAKFLFTGVKMQPGKPVVFGRFADNARFFFGLPGNPISTQVTFHCFVEPLLKALCGAPPEAPRFVQATLAEEVTGKPGLMRLLPARLTTDRIRPTVKLVAWQGSGDLAANARANCYAVLPPDRESFAAGEVITVMLRG